MWNSSDPQSNSSSLSCCNAPLRLPKQLPNDIESVEHFFGKSCAPGETDSERICSACSGDCGLHTDPYFGSVGAFRCLLEGAGDVSFVRHTTPGEYALGGLSAQVKINPPPSVLLHNTAESSFLLGPKSRKS
jgi:hypothetical protein